LGFGLYRAKLFYFSGKADVLSALFVVKKIRDYCFFVVLGLSAVKKVNGKIRSAIKDKYFFIRAPFRDI